MQLGSKNASKIKKKKKIMLNKGDKVAVAN
jgi:hypothetical protein